MNEINEVEYKFQTLKEFMSSPFGLAKDIEKINKYNTRYVLIKKKIRIDGYTSVGDDYFIHVKVPSESDETREYDVVIRFFSPFIKSINSLEKYYVQFFSNSPGFMYQYAVLYKINGFLIEDLYNKMDPDFIDKLPEKANPNKNMAYDSTIYFACKFLSENNFQYLSKFGLILSHKKSSDTFFKDVLSFKEMKTKIGEKKEKKNQVEIKRNKVRKNVTVKKVGSKSTSISIKGIHTTEKKTGKSHFVPKKMPKNKT